jgi:hypothetical protein
MFLRRYTRSKEGKTHSYYALVESVRTDAGPRQHIVAYLGELNHDQERRWQRTIVFYNRQGEAQQLRLFPDDEQLPLPEHPDVQVKPVRRGRVFYLLARSRPRRQKERAIRRRQRRGLQRALQKLQRTIAAGRLKKRDTILERLGRLKERYPRAIPFVSFIVRSGKRPQLQWTWDVAKFRAALVLVGAYLLRTNQRGWSPAEFWETYMQLTVVERAFRVLKSELLLRPIWHHYSGRTEAHVFICVLAYALWKALDQLTKPDRQL